MRIWISSKFNDQDHTARVLEIGDKIGFISKGELLWQGDRHTILQTDCKELRDFVCANTLARNIIEGGK